MMEKNVEEIKRAGGEERHDISVGALIKSSAPDVSRVKYRNLKIILVISLNEMARQIKTGIIKILLCLGIYLG